MKKLFSNFLLLTVLILFSSNAYASHLIGGEITWECLGNAPGGVNKRYNVTVVMYRDCLPGSVNFFPTLNLSAYAYPNGPDDLLGNLSSDELILEDVVIDDNDDPCVEIPEACVQKGTYKFYNVQLPSNHSGIYLSAGECCLSDNIDNIVTTTPVGSVGYAVTALIPKSSFHACYDSPTFEYDPPAYLCLYDEEALIDLSVSGGTGNVNYNYHFYEPFDNDLAAPPFVSSYQFNPGYAYDMPFEATPPMSVNSITGQMTGTPIEEGEFMNGVRAYFIDPSTGDSIGYIERTYRYFVVDCNINTSNPIIAGLTPNGTLPCGDLDVSFENNSFNAESYEWSFGDSSAISTEVEPSHTYPDYGTYQVTLISFADNTLCNDTAVVEVILDGPVDVEIDVNDDHQCLSNNDFDFKANVDNPDVTYEWDFGSTFANPQTSNVKNPSGIEYAEVGTYTVTLKVIYKECITERQMTVEVYDDKLAEITGPTSGCVPFTAVFEPSVVNSNFQYTWAIGKDTVVTQDYEYTFTKPGIYPVYLHVKDLTDGCESVDRVAKYIEIYEMPIVDFEISDQSISAGETVNIKTTKHNGYSVEYYINNILISDTILPFLYTFEKEGLFEVKVRSINGDCEVEHSKFVRVGPPRVIPPNVFTPNGDGNNDYFIINPHNNRDIELRIFDRWGIEVFYSSNYENCSSSNEENCWGGLNKGDDKCEPGTYFYILRQSNSGHERKGTVTLSR
jgi:gliding motility-associated-like protein